MATRLERAGVSLSNSFPVERLFDLTLKRADAVEAAAIVARFSRSLMTPRAQAALMQRVSGGGPEGGGSGAGESRGAAGAGAGDRQAAAGSAASRDRDRDGAGGSRRVNKQRNRDARLAGLLRAALVPSQQQTQSGTAVPPLVSDGGRAQQPMQ
jgi:hypothetical protein